MTHAPKDFTIEWRIVNFSMCPQKKGECIASPTFVVDVFDKTKWHLELYPKGDDDTTEDGCFSLHVVRTDKAEVKICFTISRSTVPATSTVKPREPLVTVKTIDKWGIIEMACQRSFSKQLLILLYPNDTFTIQCRMRKKSKVKLHHVTIPLSTETSLDELSSVISDDFTTNEYYPTKCSFCTTIPVERRQITWTIKDFKYRMRSSQRITISVLSAVREKSALILSCYASGDWFDKGYIKIDIHRKDRDLKQMLVRCKVCVINRRGPSSVNEEYEHLFGEDCDVWCYPVIQSSYLEYRKPDLLVGGQISMRCEFLITYQGEEVTAIGGNLRTCDSIEHYRNLGHDMNELLQDINFADVTLISEDRELAVHKSVLCARSPVFRAMFRGDTLENRTGIVRIIDIDAETVKNMKNFLYEGFVLDLQLEDALKLYSAADKYEILKLKKQCASCIKYNLSSSNVCDVLILADMHQDSDLRKYVENFLSLHAQDVFHSTEWEDLMKKNLQLATETIRNAIAEICHSLVHPTL